MNSSAALKAFVGEHGGAVCTSSNARAVLEWALAKGDKVLFFPDQHLGRNTGFDMGYDEADMRVWNPRLELGGLEERDVKDATLLLWKGHCSVHQRFRPEHVAAFRAEHPDGEVIVHPECAHDVVELADRVGSTERILDWVEARAGGRGASASAPRSTWCSAWRASTPTRRSSSLDPLICPCSTMFRIDGPHLAWVLESLVARRGREPDRRRPATPPSGPASRSSACSTSPDRELAFAAPARRAAERRDVGGVAVFLGLGEEAFGRARLLHALDHEPDACHRVHVLRERAVHERQHHARRELLHRDVDREVRSRRASTARRGCGRSPSRCSAPGATDG